MARYIKPTQREWTQLATGSEIRQGVRAVAEIGKTYAEARAAEFIKTGDYARSFQVVESTNILKHPRAEARLENTSDHAAAIEWPHPGTKKSHPIMRMTLEYLRGLK
jgi:hypothetical protein